MMLELSPLETAANASARSMPAARRTSRSKPMPVTVVPLNSAPSLRKASEVWSITATEWPRAGAGYAPAGAAVRFASVASTTSLAKRLLLGRPFRSDRLQHTLLPKRIALPVFASDALSSVADAPDEILLTLSIAGAGAFAYSPWVTLAVAVV